MRHPILFAAAAVFTLATALHAGTGCDRALLYPTVVDAGVNMAAGRDWARSRSQSANSFAERRKGGPFDAADPAWHVRLTAPEGSYWRLGVPVEKGHTYLMGAWVQMYNTKIAIRGYGKHADSGHSFDKRVYFYGGFNSYMVPYLSERVQQRLAGDPKEWKLVYRLVDFPEGVKGGKITLAAGIYIATGEMTFSRPFFIDVTDIADRSLTVDVSGKRPFRKLSVLASGIGDEVWSKSFPEPATSYKGTVPAKFADYTRGLDNAYIEGHTLVVTYVDGTVKRVHAPQEKSFTQRR